MREIGNLADDNVAQGPIGLRLSVFRTGAARISNRKSGIRIQAKAPKISAIQIPNRKYSPLLRSPWRIAVFDRAFHRSRHFLIYGTAIKTPRSTLKNVSHRNF
jgi:hypothetical protein